MSAFLSAGESLTPSPVTATMAPCLWHPSTMMSFCCGDVRANTISVWLASTSSIWAGVMSRRSLPCTTHAFASLQRRYSSQAIYYDSRQKLQFSAQLTAMLRCYTLKTAKITGLRWYSLKHFDWVSTCCFVLSPLAYYFTNFLKYINLPNFYLRGAKVRGYKSIDY